MSCEEIRPLITGLLEGRLSGARADRVRRHLAGCRDCAAGLSPVDRVELLPLFDSAIEPSDSLDARFRATLAAHRAASGRPQRTLVERLLGWVSAPRLAVVGVLATLLVAVVILSLKTVPVGGPASTAGEYGVAENLPLLQDLDVVQNLDLLQDLDAIQALDEGIPKPKVH
jgi:anti-sigma factor RsiW